MTRRAQCFVRSLLRGVTVTWLVNGVTIAAAETVNIAVAANFIAPMQALKTAFELNSTDRLSLSFASSGKHYAQIRQGAPFDVFLSADAEKPQQLVQRNLAVGNSQLTYALGKLALWAGPGNALTQPVQQLKTATINKLAIANPQLAPYGMAAMEAMQQLGVQKQLQNHLVYGENIAQVFHFVHSGNAQLGFVALSQIRSHPTIAARSWWLVDENLYSPIRQDAVLLNPGRNKQSAKLLLRYLHSAQAKSIITGYGYSVE